MGKISKSLFALTALITFLSIPYGVISKEDLYDKNDNSKSEDVRIVRQSGYCGNHNAATCLQFCRSKGFQKHLCTPNKCTCQPNEVKGGQNGGQGGAVGYCGNYNDAGCQQFCSNKGYDQHQCTAKECTCVPPSPNEATGGGGGGLGGAIGHCGNLNAASCLQFCRSKGFQKHLCTANKCTCEPNEVKGGQGGAVGYCGNFDEDTCNDSCVQKGYETHSCTSNQCMCLNY